MGGVLHRPASADVSTAAPAVQPALDLEPIDLAPLRQAYNAAGYQRRGISFERAMRSPALKTALMLHAEAIARQRQKAHSCSTP